MRHDELAAAIKQQLAHSYPNITVEVRPWDKDPSRAAIYFTEEKFAVLYPYQRYHYLIHAISQEFYQQYLTRSVWFELAPGEEPDDLEYPDEEIIKEITPDVLEVLRKSRFFEALDDKMSPENNAISPEPCHGDFRLTKQILEERGFSRRSEIDEVSDICHTLMFQGAYCDCEVLYNVAEESRLKAKYWNNRTHSFKG